MSCRERGGGGRIVSVSSTVAVVAAAVASSSSCMPRRRDTRERIINSSENENRPSPSRYTLLVSENNREKKDERRTVVAGKRDKTADNCRTRTRTTEVTASGRSDDVVETTLVAEKFSVDFEKWFKREPTSMDLDGKVTEDVDQYLGGEALSPHSFLEKDPYGLSIDIDLATEEKKEHLTDPILQMPSEKVDDEYILSDFHLYHLDTLTLSPDDMMEILPSDQSTLYAAESQDDVSRSGDDCKKSTRIAVNDPKDKEESKKVEATEDDTKQEAVQSSAKNPSGLFMGILAPIGENLSKVERQEAPQVSDAIMEQLKARVKLEPRIIKKRGKMSEKRLGRSFIRDDGQDDVMAVVAISTDKTSNMTQIVINTGKERQVYQGKTSELIEATGNFPMLPKIDVWNGISSVDNSGNSQYEIVISKALEELGITDDSLQPVCVTAHDKVWLCPQDDCNRQFGRLYTLKGHLLTHYGVRPFKCDHEGCAWAFYSEFKLKRHKETHLKRKDHVCEVEGCNRRFTTVYNLWSHAKLHSRPNRIFCQVPDCEEKFQTKRALELHMKSHDQRHAPYVCQHCGKRYYSNNALTSHQRSHSYKEVDVKCSWPGCGKVFDKPCRLKAHTRSHTGCKPYHCTYQDCKWSFSSSSKLKRHQKKHTNERKFACEAPGCGKAFMRSEHLKEHRLTHTEGRYFHCFVCDARFSAKSSLYVHIKKHQTKMLTKMDDLSNAGRKGARTKASHFSRAAKPIQSVSMEPLRLEESDAASCDDSTYAFHKDQLRTAYYCPIETCAYLYSNETTLRQHALKVHGVIVQCEEDSLQKGPSITDYVLCKLSSSTSPSLSSPPLPSSSALSTTTTTWSLSSPIAAVVTADEKTVMTSDEVRVVNLSASSSLLPTKRAVCYLSKPASFDNVVLPKISVQPLRTDEAVQEAANKDHGSARTSLTLSDVLRRKIYDAQTDAVDRSVVTSCVTTSSSSSSVALGTGDLCGNLLFIEELPSVYYQDDPAGAEYQVLLLDSSPLESAGNLRGYE
ncbi:PREDICTED: uncharacterized protein LOC106744457 [Dinoponera quadriceps]|uniref:Uncharacterized protein LOC106744457 n=1 Tax=Dinoponera quadriceps TaxID=609295 RepID=A0A6P3X922_DINQU|nr:PREDICTED: uncharacterized protein LOC106744457 [Dinoponera quadriceps]